MPSPLIRPARPSKCSTGKQLLKFLTESPQVRQDRTRINVISPALCDDVIRRLQPSFNLTRPLDIIDINPGVCLWSTKIHDALRPRTHVLVESDRDAYRSYIDPLLQKQGSRYRYVPGLSDLFSGLGAQFLPDQTPVTSGTNYQKSTNDSLLILANLSSSNALPFRFGGTPAVQQLNQYVSGIMNPENSFHHYGLVRMLAWLPDHQKASFIPRVITDRTKFSVRLDAVAQVSEIAGAAFPPLISHLAKRGHKLVIESGRLAAQRASEAGVWDPEHRRPPSPTPPWYEIGLCPDALDQLRRLPHKLPWQVKLLELADISSDMEPQASEQVPEAKEPGGQPWAAEPQELRSLRSMFLTRRKANMLVQQRADRQNALDKAAREFSAKGVSTSMPAATKEDIHQEAASLHAKIRKGRKDMASAALKYIDDLRGFDQDPPLLQWDRRAAEPLVVRKDEFYPRKEMALLDLKPAAEVLDKLTDFDKRTSFGYLCSILFSNPAKSVRNDLNTVVQGGLDDFIGRVPDLLDPTKGGNHNLDDLRIRTLPINLLVQLALALETWPFRLKTHEMLIGTGRKKPSLLLEDT